jgi:hypothetical protein
VAPFTELAVHETLPSVARSADPRVEHAVTLRYRRHAIVSIRFSARREDRFERRSTPEGRCYLVLKNHEGLVLGETPRYESNDACEQAARRLRLAASEARVVYFPKPGSDRNA